MHQINQEIGKRLRDFRKMRNLTLEELASLIHKSKSTVSKYEKGEISLDIETLYQLAEVLKLPIEQLLITPPQTNVLPQSAHVPAFFSGQNRLYAYIFDGRIQRLTRIVIDIYNQDTECPRVMLYMNFKDPEHYQNCENTYFGTIEHYDAVTNLLLTNRDLPMEKASLQVLASFLDSDTKWGLWNGFSTRPMMPVANKMLLSKNPLQEDAALIKQCKVSKEDIRLFKLYNMLSVT